MKSRVLWIPLLFVPSVANSNVLLTNLIFTFILGILAISFNLIFGFTGQLSLFHAAAFGLSAYATYLSMQHWGVTFWVGMIVGVAFVTLISIVIGAICFRFKLRELYFSIDQSLAIIAMALLGGREFVAAPLVGALVLTALPHLIEVNAEARLLIYGFILIVTILLMPTGIVGVLARRRRAA